jgi:ribosomal protein L13
MDTGDVIIVIHPEKIKLMGNKEDDKEYMVCSAYQVENNRSRFHRRKKNPEFLKEHEVRGMFPKNKLSRK